MTAAGPDTRQAAIRNGGPCKRRETIGLPMKMKMKMKLFIVYLSTAMTPAT